MPSKGRLFRNQKDGIPYGSYRFYIPAMDGRSPETVSLGTSDLTEAERLAEETLARLSPSPAIVDSGVNNAAEANPQPSHNPADLLREWSETSTPIDEPGNSDLPGSVDEPPADQGPDEPVDRPKTKKELMQERAPVIAAALCKLVTSVNVAVVGLTVKTFGRQPEEPGEADRELLELGWRLQFEEYLFRKPPEPWMLIVAASAGIAISMYVNGEPIADDTSADLS